MKFFSMPLRWWSSSVFKELFFFLCRRARQGDRCRQFRRQYKNYTNVWLYKWRSLEKFLRLTQKIPISFSGAKVGEHCDATILKWSQEPRYKGQSPRSKAHNDQIVSVEALRSVQSVNGATKALRVEAFMCVVSRMLHHSFFSSSLSFFWVSLVQGNETYETGCNSHAWANNSQWHQNWSSRVQMAKAIQMVRPVLPHSLSFFFCSLFFFSFFFLGANSLKVKAP